MRYVVTGSAVSDEDCGQAGSESEDTVIWAYRQERTLRNFMLFEDGCGKERQDVASCRKLISHRWGWANQRGELLMWQT